MTGIRSKVVIAGVAALALAGCGSSGPTPLQKWETGSGLTSVKAVNHALNQITSDAQAGNTPAIGGDGGALESAASTAYRHCPPVACGTWQKAMTDYVAAGLGLYLYGQEQSDPSGFTGSPSAALGAAEIKIQQATDTLKGAPWAKAVATG